MSTPLRIALVNGYTEAAREGFRREGIPQAEDIFRACMKRYLPEAELDPLYPESGPDFLSGKDLDQYAAFMLSGSSGTIYDGSPGSARQIEFMRTLLRGDRPIWGSCWGMQVATMAAGGKVERSPNGREWVVARQVRVLEPAHAMFTGKPQEFDTPAMHLDEVTRLPEGATLLATNEHSRVQAFELPQEKCVFWGVQYHPELDARVMKQLVDSRREMILAEGKAQSNEELDTICADLDVLAEREYDLGPLEDGSSIGADAQLRGVSQRLGMHWTTMERSMAERELANWTEFCVKPALADRS